MSSCSNHKKCVKESLKKAEEICKEKNLRFTDLRKNVFLIILQSHQPSKAYDILDVLKKNDSSAKPPTIYRALDFLLENGLIHKLHISNSYVSCSHPLKHKKCSFLICNKCHEVSECCDEKLTQELYQIGLQNNFEIQDANVEIRGICSSCS